MGYDWLPRDSYQVLASAFLPHLVHPSPIDGQRPRRHGRKMLRRRVGEDTLSWCSSVYLSIRFLEIWLGGILQIYTLHISSHQWVLLSASNPQKAKFSLGGELRERDRDRASATPLATVSNYLRIHIELAGLFLSNFSPRTEYDLPRWSNTCFSPLLQGFDGTHKQALSAAHVSHVIPSSPHTLITPWLRGCVSSTAIITSKEETNLSRGGGVA